jgi:hypothetical protein
MHSTAYAQAGRVNRDHYSTHGRNSNESTVKVHARMQTCWERKRKQTNHSTHSDKLTHAGRLKKGGQQAKLGPLHAQAGSRKGSKTRRDRSKYQGGQQQLEGPGNATYLGGIELYAVCLHRRRTQEGVHLLKGCIALLQILDSCTACG